MSDQQQQEDNIAAFRDGSLLVLSVVHGTQHLEVFASRYEMILKSFAIVDEASLRQAFLVAQRHFYSDTEPKPVGDVDILRAHKNALLLLLGELKIEIENLDPVIAQASLAPKAVQ